MEGCSDGAIYAVAFDTLDIFKDLGRASCEGFEVQTEIIAIFRVTETLMKLEEGVYICLI